MQKPVINIHTAKRDKLRAISKAMEIARKDGTCSIIKEELTRYSQNSREGAEIKLVCFDMDSTITKIETIDAIAEIVGKKGQINIMTALAMKGEIDFEESFRQRVKMLKGTDVGVLEKLASSMPVAEGLDNLMQYLKRKGVITVILTGNFNCFGEALKERFGFNHIYTSTPGIEYESAHGNNKEIIVPDNYCKPVLNGEISGEIITGKLKREIMERLCKEMNISLRQVAAIGDGANDIPMLDAAGTAIIYNAATASQGIEIIKEYL